MLGDSENATSLKLVWRDPRKRITP